ncbi:hypothetical protein HPB50_026380 [Hyalomma asiaticum]|uniref:Uncharacterized protein n=1 Tax=Hyalomma asiaticum TaxID=266040 RepID=A0ACB7TMJ4_HYAAI|nr:hypothetical protein HPB50_026380 [Hyalomma asiaticum]
MPKELRFDLLFTYSSSLCIGFRSELCHLPLDEALCNSSSGAEALAKPPEMRFYYDVQKEECLPFSYGGCGGNDNNFRTHGGCNLTCFGVEVTIPRTSASCPEPVDCSCGNLVQDEERGCNVCDCSSAASKNGAV